MRQEGQRELNVLGKRTKRQLDRKKRADLKRSKMRKKREKLCVEVEQNTPLIKMSKPLGFNTAAWTENNTITQGKPSNQASATFNRSLWSDNG